MNVIHKKNCINFLRKILSTLISTCCLALSCGAASAADNFADAQEVGFGSWISESNQNATVEPSEPAGLGYRTLWWKFTTTKRCVVTVKTPESPVIGLGHYLTVFRGAGYDALNVIEKDSARSYESASVSFPAEAGMTFRVCIGTYYSDEIGNVTFSLLQSTWPYGTNSVVTPAEPSDQTVPNDRFEDAQTLPSNVSSCTVIGYVGSATAQPDESSSSTGVPAVWYSWKAPYSGTLRISTPQSTHKLGFGHKISVFTGADSSVLTSIATGTALQSIISDDHVDLTFPIQSGKTYRISFGFFSYLDSFGETPFSYILELDSQKSNPDITVKTVEAKILKDGSSKRDFGAVKVGKKSSQPFIIRNDGKGPLKVLAIRKDGKHPNDFAIVQVANPSLNTGMESSFQVRFKPTKSGPRSAIVRIISNDPDESPFDFTVTGTGMP